MAKNSVRVSSAFLSSQIRAKSLSLHDHSLRAERTPNRAPTLDSDAPDSCHMLATSLLRRTRNELDITQDRAAALAEVHVVSLGRRERGEVDLGPLRDWALLLREMVRTKGSSATAQFMVSFIEALAQKDTKK